MSRLFSNGISRWQNKMYTHQAITLIVRDYGVGHRQDEPTVAAQTSGANCCDVARQTGRTLWGQVWNVCDSADKSRLLTMMVTIPKPSMTLARWWRNSVEIRLFVLPTLTVHVLSRQRYCRRFKQLGRKHLAYTGEVWHCTDSKKPISDARLQPNE